MNRIYEYRLREPDEGAQTVLKQMRLAHEYYNELIAIVRKRHERYRELMRALGAAEEADEVERREAVVDEAVAAVKKLRGKEEADGYELAQQRLKNARAALRLAQKELVAKNRKIRKTETGKAALEELDAWALEERKKARRKTRVYSGTYLQIEAAADRADKDTKKTGSLPRYRRWTGEGMIAVHVVHLAKKNGKERVPALTLERLFDGTSRLAAMDPVDPIAHGDEATRQQRVRGSRTRLWLRAKSNRQGNPVWASWPMIYHRPLPPDCKIKDVRVHRTLIADRSHWKVQFSVEEADPLPTTASGAIAIDIGWRARPDGMRVAYWADTRGNSGELLLPERVLYPLERADRIRGHRDRLLDELKADLQPKLAELDLDALFDAAELDEEGRQRWKKSLPHMQRWRSPRRFVRLLRAGWLPEPLQSRVGQWQQRDLHLWRYEVGDRTGARLHRREIYRAFASKLKSYARVYVEDFDLRKVQQRPPPEVMAQLDDKQERRAARQRVYGAVYVLRSAIENVVTREGASLLHVEPAGSTQDCHACEESAPGKWDAAVEVMHTCEVCDVTWDQDYNAAMNLLARGEVLDEDPEALAKARKLKSKRKSRFEKRNVDDGASERAAGADRSRAAV